MTTSENVATAVLKLVVAEAVPAVLSHLVMGNVVKRDYRPEVQESGDTVKLDNVPIVLKSHVEATMSISDVSKALVHPELVRVFMQPATIAIAECIDRDLLKLYDHCTAHPPVGSAIEDLINAVEGVLFIARVPLGSKYLVVNPGTYGKLRELPNFREYSSASEARLNAPIQGTVGGIRHVFILRSQMVPVTDAPPPRGPKLGFARDALGLVVRRLAQPVPSTHPAHILVEYAEIGDFGLMVSTSYQPNSLEQTFTIAVLYGCGVLRPEQVVRVNT